MSRREPQAALVLGRARSTQAESRVDSAETVRVARRDVGSVATGIVKPRVGAEVRVGSRVSGVVKRLYVWIGDTVRKGQLLAELDEEDLVARRDEAGATLAQSKVDLSYAMTDLRRKRELASAGGISRSDLDLAEQALYQTLRFFSASEARTSTGGPARGPAPA